MKKMWNKKGFSLAEMMIVIAIIVILSGATAVGVVSWLKSAQNTQNVVLNNNGDNFENAARLAVESYAGKAPRLVKERETMNEGDPKSPEWWAENDKKWEKRIEDYKKDGCPDDQITVIRDKDGHIVGIDVDWNISPTTEATTGNVEEETTTVKQQEGTTTVKQKEDPTTTAKKKEDPTTTAKKKEDPTTTAGRVGNPTGTTAVEGSSVSGTNVYNFSVNLPANAQEVTLYIPDARVTNFSSFNGYNSSWNGRYVTITIPDGASSFGCSCSGNGNLGSVNISQFKVVSYVPK